MGINFRFPRSGGGSGKSISIDENRTNLQTTFDGQTSTPSVTRSNYDGGQFAKANDNYLSLPLPNAPIIKPEQKQSSDQKGSAEARSERSTYFKRNFGINFRYPRSAGGRFFENRIDEGRSGLSVEYTGSAEVVQAPDETSITDSPYLTLYLNRTGMNLTSLNINRWDNAKSGQQIVSFTASAGNARPTQVSLNGNESARFVRTESDLMTDLNSNGFLGLVNTSSYHCFIVAHPETITTTNSFIINDEVIIAETNARWVAGFRLSSSVPVVTVQHVNKANQIRSVSSIVPVQETSLIEWWYDSSSIHLRVNSGTVYTTGSTNVFEVGSTQMRLGRGSTASLSGVIGTIAVFNRNLSTDESEDIRTYLAQTFNITTV